MPDLAVLERLRAGIQTLEGATHPRAERRCVSTSFTELDELLPGGGLPLGTFIEVLSAGPGHGALSLSFRMAREALKLRPAWVVVDGEQTFNPAACAGRGLDVKALIWVRPPPREAGWACAQVLRSPDVGACFWSAPDMDNMLFRRLQLSAERGGGLGFVIRPLSAQRKPCWSGVRLLAQRVAERWVEVTVLHTQAGARGIEPKCRVDVF